MQFFGDQISLQRLFSDQSAPLYVCTSIANQTNFIHLNERKLTKKGCLPTYSTVSSEAHIYLGLKLNAIVLCMIKTYSFTKRNL